jgi:3-phosphoshikimate 1-carboxyvinyltransferase
VQPAQRLQGTIVVPGDKSISHRALLFAALAEGDSLLEALADGADVASTLAAVRALGVEVVTGADGGRPGGEDAVRSSGATSLAARSPARRLRHRRNGPLTARVGGAGLDGLREASGPIDCGNSGTTMRLLAGILAGQPFDAVLTGDRSLCGRPMRRVAGPLQAMGATVETSRNGTAPLRIRGRRPLRGILHRPEVASAQIKSCVLLAGLFAAAPTTVEEPVRTRDHSERLLAAMGARIDAGPAGDAWSVRIEPPARLVCLSGRVPADVSSAAYWVAAAALLPGSRLELPGVGLNPTRTAFLDVLRGWGADIEVEPAGDWHGEPVGTIRVAGGDEPLAGGNIEPAMVAGLIDELPLLAALGPATADGVEIRGAAELRVKESDRIAATAAALRGLGVKVDEFPDGLAVRGGQRLSAGTIEARGDHRIALAMAAVGLTAAGPVIIAGAEAMAVSYPGFAAALEEVAVR